jgi:hypothetical protein
MRFHPTQEFEKWAKDFSGFDGGNPESPLWICGIEPGADQLGPFILSPDWTYSLRNKDIPAWTEKLKGLKNPFYGYTTPFLQRASKIAFNYFEQDGTWDNFRTTSFLVPGGTGFLINLYPLAFKDLYSKWTTEHFRRTGFPNKELYRAWCMENRFPVIKNWVTDLSPTPPKVIICVGIRMRLDFLLAFSDSTDPLFIDPSNTHPITSAHISQNVEIHEINGGTTKLLMAPFLGRGGLMSDESLKEVAKIAAKL